MLLTVMGDGVARSRRRRWSYVSGGSRKGQESRRGYKWAGICRHANAGEYQVNIREIVSTGPKFVSTSRDLVMEDLMREDGENGVPLSDALDNSMEEVIMESLCHVAIRTSGALAHYHHFTGLVRYIGGNETVEDPVGAVGTPTLSWRLPPDVGDESCWSVFRRRGLVWENVCQLPRQDVHARGVSVKRGFATSSVLEWAHAVSAALKLEHVMYNRVWVCVERCVKILRKFISFEDFFVDVVRHKVAQVSFRRPVSLSERARSVSHPFLETLVDYRSALSVSWGLVHSGSSEFVVPVSRPSSRGGASGRSPFDMVIPDSFLRGFLSWKMAISG